MKKIFYLLTFLFINAVSFSQNTFTVSGKIIDAVTKMPMQAASVSAQNTTIGTTTDNQGSFSLTLPNGGYNLVITYTGYETEFQRISTSDADNKTLQIELKLKTKAMEDVAVKASNEVKNGWEQYGNFFLENFIGKTANSRFCTIKNKDAIHFYFSKRKNRLKVLATEPVKIENLALGYNISYALDSFTYDYATTTSLYTGVLLFEEMTTSDSIQKKTWEQGRAAVYKGSLLHLMRSIYNKKLKEEGFEIQFIAKAGTHETPIQLKDYYGALNYDKDDSTQSVEILPNQPEVAILFKQKPEELYSIENPDEPKDFQLSVLSFTPGQSLIIEQNGFCYNEYDFIVNQYIGWKKMADLLPYNYMLQ